MVLPTGCTKKNLAPCAFFDWNADGTQLAFVRFDEQQVPEFSMDVYGAGLYPTQQTFKYPKAGEPNSVVSLHIYDLAKAKTTPIALEAYYIPRLQWSNNPKYLTVQTLNRHQKRLATGASRCSNFSNTSVSDRKK